MHLDVNVVLTLVIAIVVHRSGLEKAVQAIHAECGLATPNSASVLSDSA